MYGFSNIAISWFAVRQTLESNYTLQYYKVDAVFIKYYFAEWDKFVTESFRTENYS